MKYGIMFANIGPYGAPEALTHLAQTAERTGFESMWTVEHVVVPKGYASAYPYSRDGKMPGPETAPIPDPFVWLAYAAAVTKTIQLGTGVLILPQRHPFYVAKEVATLDALSGGRVQLGVGIGWLEEEFRSLGVPFKTRAARAEESVAALRSLWSEGPSEFHGEHFDWNPVESHPKPAAGRVPIHVGGHVAGAARRAARVGDGYFPARPDGLDAGLKAMREECEKIGRDPGEIEITTGGVTDPDARRALEDLGVARVVIGPPGYTPDAVERGLEKFANEVIAKSA